jgi:glycosyltransferase involved in cell wall biosynthesis
MTWPEPSFTSWTQPCENLVRILLVHNYYLQPGGEDQVFAAETETLRAHGEEVQAYTVHNSRIAAMSRLTLAKSTIWNRQVAAELTTLLGDFQPDLVHFHNTFPLVSPAAYVAVQRAGIPVVQTLHNFRLLCLNGLFLRNGRACEDCLGRATAWPGVRHACYRQSRPASAVVAAMLAVHRGRRTWQTAVDTYIALSEFARRKFVAGGLPSDRIVVKPNFLLRDPGSGSHGGKFALYVGRLSPEKGIGALVRLWALLDPGIPLRVIGSGPLQSLAAGSPSTVEWLGWLPHDRVLAAMRDASFLVFPSKWYEGFPMVLLEAMATGLPVIASRYGSLPEIVEDGESGLLIAPGDTERWTDILRWAISHPQALAAMGRRARQLFERKYTQEKGSRMLLDVYRQTIKRTGTTPT